MKAYKGFNRDMTCSGFQYEEGKEYEEEEAKLCKSGFHACENPLDTFRYYVPGQSVYHEVELDGVSDERELEDTKVCAKKIKIGARLDVAGICKAHFDYVSSKCVPANGRVAGDEESAAAGDSGSAAAGDCGSAAAGDRGSAAAGDWGSAAAGYRGSAAAGDCGSAAAGYRGSAAAGYRGSAAAGDWGSAAAGNCGSAAAGKHGLACARGGKAKGLIGAVICVTETDGCGKNISLAAGIVDGVKIKADTWYKCENGKLVEA